MEPIRTEPAGATIEAHALQVGPHRLAGPHGPLASSGVEVKLAPKTLAVLWTLAGAPGRVFTKAALLDAVWGEIAVGEDSLGFQIQALRQALDDDARRPRYIETVHRIGYRFIAPVATAPANGVATRAPQPAVSGVAAERRAAPVLVGRESELARLDALLARTLDGHRQMAFVTGAAGIGKTALVETFLAGQRTHPLAVARGHCVEQSGGGESFLPLFDAVSRLCRDPCGEHALEILRRHAPSWLAQLPTVIPLVDREAFQHAAQWVTRERMLRELCEALEALTTDQPVVLVVDDLQWADPATVEWLAMVARRPEAARLLVLGTYRSADLCASAHPLKAVKQELVARGQATELALEPLDRAAVATFVDQRLAGHACDDTHAAFVYRRSEGHPMFMVLVADLMAAGRPAPAAGAPLHAIDRTVPTRVRELVDAELERLPIEAQRVLEVASVAGTEFTVASLAAVAEMELEPVERICERLARRGQFIEDRGVTQLPDGTVDGCYRFRHALYRDALEERLGPGQRARLRAPSGPEGPPHSARAGRSTLPATPGANRTRHDRSWDPPEGGS
jgi:DNA-binding winged helix-turn-helix (wHTH) protein